MTRIFPIALTATPAQVRCAPILLRGDLAGAFRTAAELGCAGLEVHLRYPSDVQAGQLKRWISDYGLAVPTIGTGMAATLDGLTFAHPDASIRRQALERLRAHVDLAAEIGSAVTVGSVSGRLGPDEAQRSQRRAAALDALAELCRYAHACSVTILLEPLNRYECDYLNTVADVLNVAEEIGAPNLKLLADTFHMNIEETDIAAALAAAGPRLGHVHLADSNRQAPGRGHLDFAPVLASLARSGYRGFLSFEILPVPDPLTAAQQGIRTVQVLSDRLTAAQKGE